MAKKQMILVRRKIRLLLVAVRAISLRVQQTFLALARLHGFLVTRGSSMQHRFLGGNEVHRAEGAEVRRRSRVHHDLALLLVLGDVISQLVTLKRDQRPEDLGAQIALDTLLIHVRRGVARGVTGLPGVQTQLEVVLELPIATAAG